MQLKTYYINIMYIERNSFMSTADKKYYKNRIENYRHELEYDHETINYQNRIILEKEDEIKQLKYIALCLMVSTFIFFFMFMILVFSK